MILVGIIVAIVMFTLIVIIHEWGHFSAARFFGVKVNEFGIGIPPRAKKLFYDKKNTLYSLNWLPLGGFVKLHGENTSTDKTDPTAFVNKPYWQQAIIVLGGVFMNFLLAIIIFSFLFMIGVKPIGINNQIPTENPLKIIPTYEQALESGFLIKNPGVILNPIENSIAQKSGIKKGDILLSINNLKISNTQEAIKLINSNKEKNIKLIVQTIDNTTKQIILTPGSDGKIGSYLGENIKINESFQYKYGFLKALKYGTLETYYQTILTLKGLGILGSKIINPQTPTERNEAIQKVTGPVGIVDFISNTISQGIIFLLIISAIISLSLGLFNLLPIPALDGGRFLFIVINGFGKALLSKKLINDKTEGSIHVLFFVLLIAFSMIIMYNDITRIINN